MTKLLRASWIALLGLAVATPTALAEKTTHGQMTVDDQAKMFSANGIKQAEQVFDGATFKAKTHYTVVTRDGVPESKKADLTATKGDKAKASRFFGDWAKEIYKDRHATGVLTLIYVEGDKFFVKTVADEQNDVFRHFNDKDATRLEEKFIATFRDAKSKGGGDAATIRDSGLLSGAKFVVDELKDTSVPASHTTKSTSGEKKGMGIGGYICIGLCVLLGVWVVIALIRALTGGGGGYGGGGMGGGGYGGGGGGFMSSFVGGMFGAAAGMWMYNNMFGGSHMNDMTAGESLGDGGAIDTGEGNVDTGAEGEGGGDWGDSGGDAGGGGGDWGDSGGDAGGGGDWGGGDSGGGDFGGGGDW